MSQQCDINSLRPRRDWRQFADVILKCIFLTENICALFKFHWSLFSPKGPINNIPTFGPIMACRRPGDKPLSEPVIVLWTLICSSRPECVKRVNCLSYWAFCFHLITNYEICIRLFPNTIQQLTNWRPAICIIPGSDISTNQEGNIIVDCKLKLPAGPTFLTHCIENKWGFILCLYFHVKFEIGWIKHIAVTQ